MTVQNKAVFQTWIMHFSLATTLIVVVLSLLNAVRIPYIILRGGISFGVIYLLLTGLLCLFEKTALPIPEEEQLASDTGRGGFIDFSVGDGDGQSQTRPPEETKATGQADGQATGQATSQATGQADFGLNEGTILSSESSLQRNSQVDSGLNKGMPDGERQAEAVRRMSWDDS